MKLSGAQNGATHIELNPVNGDLILNITNGFFNDNSKPYEVWGNNGKTLMVNGTLGVGGTASNVTFTIEQNSTVVFGAAQSYSGDTFVLNGKLQFTSSGNANNSTIRLGNTSGSANAEIDLITATGGVTLSSTINPRAGSSGTLKIDSQNTSGINTLSGHFGLDHSLTINQASGGTLAFTQGRGTASGSTNGFDIKNFTLTLTGAGSFTFGPASPTGFGTIYDSASGGSGTAIVMAGTGSLSLNDANSYRGKTQISSGTLFVGANNALGSSNGTVGTTGNTVFVGDTTGSSNARLLTTGAYTVANIITAQTGNSGIATIGSNTVAASIYSDNIFLGTSGANSAKDVTLVAALGGVVEFQGTFNENTNNTTVANITIGDATHSGTVKLSNSNNGYSGITAITNGATLEVVDLSAGNSSIGNSPSTAANLVLDGGTLKYTGAGESTARLFTFTANGGAIDASAASNAALNFMANGASASGTGDRTLTLTGTSTGANTLASIVANPGSGATLLTKSGVGTWTLTGANTYAGTTNVNGGTLLVNGNQSSATGPVTVNNGGTLLGGTGTIGGSVIVNAGANITGATFGVVGNLTLSGSSSLTFTGTSGNLATYLVDISGTTSDRLIISGSLNLSGAYDQITFSGTPNGTSTYTLATYSSLIGTFDSFSAPAGYSLSYGLNQLNLVPVPEPSSVAIAAGLFGLIGWRERRKMRQARAVERRAFGLTV